MDIIPSINSAHEKPMEVIIDTKKNRCLLTNSTIDPVSYDGWGLFFWRKAVMGKLWSRYY